MTRRKSQKSSFQTITGIAESKAQIDRIRRLDEERRAEFIAALVEEKKAAHANTSKDQRGKPGGKVNSDNPTQSIASDNDDAKATYALLMKFWQSPLGGSLDHHKLAHSPHFSKLTKYVANQARVYNNTEPAQNLVRLFERTQLFEPVFRWLCDSAGLGATLTHEAHVKFCVQEPKGGICQVFPDYLARYAGDIRDVFRPRETGSTDLLDSPLLVSGSYGSGKRR